MKSKQKLKIAVDAAMTLALLFLMGYQLWGEAAHEWVGAGIFLLFILHHALNPAFYKSLLRGKYTPRRAVTLTVDVLLLITVLALTASGILLSRHTFAFLNITGFTALARLMHLAASYWGFVLMAVHLGLHWGIFLAMLRAKKPSKERAAALNVVAGGLSAYGLAALFARELPSCLFLTTQFVFFDYEEPFYTFYLDYLCIAALFIFLAHHGAKLLKTKGATKT